MFERYTEKARRVIFFARYEASQYGSPYIETEHLLLGILREDKALTNRILRSHPSVESIRKQIEAHTIHREPVSTSVDLPLSDECNRVLAYAAEEAERLDHKHIDTQHLLLGLLREERCFAAQLLHERGLRVAQIREEVFRSGEMGFEPSEPRTAVTSTVTITSTPPGADIQVDGVFVGHTPAELRLATGERAISITKQNYKPCPCTLHVLPASKQTIFAELEPITP